MKIRCLIIDDEPPARALMASYLSQLERFEVTAQFASAVEAFGYLQVNDVDLLLLDIQMPNMTGIELIKTLRLPPRIILTTAFRDFAVESFELDVLDYLVKPISFERFMKAISKYYQYSLITSVEEPNSNAFDKAYIFLKVDREQVKVMLREIIYIEGVKDYLKVVTEKKSYIVYHRMTSMEEKLPGKRFVRIHKSFIVSIDKIVSFHNESLNVGMKELPIGRTYKKLFLETFQQQRRK
jgi:DNA-binding LytR/AlgR family response regulator